MSKKQINMSTEVRVKDDTAAPTEKQNDDLFLKDLAERVLRLARRFFQSSFDQRRRELASLRSEINALDDKEVRGFAIGLESLFLDRHIKLTILSVRRKYGITKKPTEKDFRRICEGEGILIVNDVPNKKTKIVEQYPLYVNAPLGQTFLAFDGRLKGRELLRSQFQLLGYHFLHRKDMPPIEKAFDECVEVAETRREEAMQFALHFVDTNAEVKR